VLSINWARGHKVNDLTSHFGGSVYHTKGNKVVKDESVLIHNHRFGLYYSYLAECRSHYCFFHYDGGAFAFATCKPVEFLDSATQQGHTGPTMLYAANWNASSRGWSKSYEPDSGFTKCCSSVDHTLNGLLSIASPFDVERFISFSTAQRLEDSDWSSVNNIPTVRLDRTEIINRTAVNFEPSQRHRIDLLSQCNKLRLLLAAGSLNAPFIKGTSADWELTLNTGQICSNLCKRGTSQRAAAVYLGPSTVDEADKLYRSYAQFAKADELPFVVWYEQADQLASLYHAPKITTTFESPTSITSVNDI
jgi:hypothetical protein